MMAEMPEKLFRRCRHVVEENERVLAGGKKLRAGDLKGFGELMRESHRSLRDLYEVSCKELDLMVELGEGLPGYLRRTHDWGRLWRMHAESGGGRVRAEVCACYC